jgi:hypothetical protein
MGAKTRRATVIGALKANHGPGNNAQEKPNGDLKPLIIHDQYAL